MVVVILPNIFFFVLNIQAKRILFFGSVSIYRPPCSGVFIFRAGNVWTRKPDVEPFVPNVCVCRCGCAVSSSCWLTRCRVSLSRYIVRLAIYFMHRVFFPHCRFLLLFSSCLSPYRNRRVIQSIVGAPRNAP